MRSSCVVTVMYCFDNILPKQVHNFVRSIIILLLLLMDYLYQNNRFVNTGLITCYVKFSGLAFLNIFFHYFFQNMKDRLIDWLILNILLFCKKT